MIEHVVLFKIKQDAGDEQKRELKCRLLELQSKIPGIIHATFGTNYSARAKGYTHGFVVRFQSKESLDRYQTHPAHVAAVEQCVRPISEDVLALDYEI